MIDFLKTFRIHNRKRAQECFKHETGIVWWTNAIAGEAGEACNISKKLTRDGQQYIGGDERTKLFEELTIELADIITYCDLLLDKLGIEMQDILEQKFDIVSERCGYRFRFRNVSDATRSNPR